ncbi:hypothetical protein [Rhizobium sp. SG2393]|uniref:hypothetical protein n=1 Tax=Rhizobium sp. SG2393 TaxID=3276279 RepID=UPI00366AD54A
MAAKQDHDGSGSKYLMEYIDPFTKRQRYVSWNIMKFARNVLPAPWFSVRHEAGKDEGSG